VVKLLFKYLANKTSMVACGLSEVGGLLVSLRTASPPLLPTVLAEPVLAGAAQLCPISLAGLRF
jgi:hypothetical protein